MRDRFELQRIVSAEDARVIHLVNASDAYLQALYPPESNHAEPLDVLVGRSSAFFAGFLGESAVACGAVKLRNDDGRYGEIKRLFVAEPMRGRGYAKTLMQRLEQFALEHGIGTIRLETGTLQPEALELYRRLAYVERGPFGRYRPDPFSVFMEKTL